MTIKFSDVLAQSIHDIKNSLGMILHRVDELLSNSPDCVADLKAARLFQHEAGRANSNLVQLLSLYKLEEGRLAPNVTEHNLADFFEDLVAEHQAVCDAMGLQLEVDCDGGHTGYLDEDLVRGVLGSTIGNAQRYARTRIRLGADASDGWLVLRVEDDGDGYPAGMLAGAAHETIASDGFSTGRTHLGLYFAGQVARLHQAGARVGRVVLRNGHQLPGSCFELWLP